MTTSAQSRSAQIRANLKHPVIDSDGHFMEFQPAYFDFLKEVGGAEMVKRVRETPFAGKTSDWYRATPEQRAKQRMTRAPWWTYPAKNTLDRATATLPRLLYERLGEMGLDFTVLYPSVGLGMSSNADVELRRTMSRAFNQMNAATYREFSDRMTPVALIPMHSPAEAIEELEYVVRTLGMKAILMPSYVMRPRADGQGSWYDNFCIDSQHDYDPVWAKCIELKVVPTFHSVGFGWGSRTTIHNFTYNHIGHFAASAEALCKAMLIGGVTYRFPDLRVAFLEGGAAWACSLYADLIGHWSKRRTGYLQETNPANVDREMFLDLCRKYGGSLVARHLEDKSNLNLAVYRNPEGPLPEDASLMDDFARCGIDKAEDIRDRFVPNFYFGCEADDPMNAWAFDTAKNPFGAKLRVIFGSDIGHWDVPDMSDVTAEAYELVEDGQISEEDFREFVFVNPIRLWTHSNRDFFKGTAVEDAVSKVAAD